MGDFTNFWEYSKSNKLDHDNQLFRIQAVHHFLEEGISLAQAQIIRLESMERKVDAQAKKLGTRIEHDEKWSVATAS